MRFTRLNVIISFQYDSFWSVCKWRSFYMSKKRQVVIFVVKLHVDHCYYTKHFSISCKRYSLVLFQDLSCLHRQKAAEEEFRPLWEDKTLPWNQTNVNLRAITAFSEYMFEKNVMEQFKQTQCAKKSDLQSTAWFSVTVRKEPSIYLQW